MIVSIGCQNKQLIEADLLITGATVYDGQSVQPQNWQVAVTGDKIVYAGDGEQVNIEAEEIIDASGHILAPGFIDPHTHTTDDLNSEEANHNLPFLTQGVTTVVTGNDGRSPIPVGRAINQWSQNGSGTNVVLLVGHGNVRRIVMGMEDRAPTEEEMDEMKSMVRQAMEDGAFGMSTGLYYTPGNYAETEEVIELAKIVSEFGGIYDTHQRDESSYNIGLLNSVREVIRIGAEAKLPVHISHIKALGVDVWDKSTDVINLFDSARAVGIDITANQYPYVASGSGIGASTFPNWARAGGVEAMEARINDPEIGKQIRIEMADNLRRRGGPASLRITRSPEEAYIGKTLADLSEEWNLDPIEAAIKIILEGDASVASFNMKESDIANFMRQEWCYTGSDGSSGHPRKYGTYTRKIRKYVLEDSVISMGHMINNSTGKVAALLKLDKRGLIAPGYFADLVILNPSTVKDRATFDEPEQISDGIAYVFVNGKLAVKDNEYQNVLAGKILKKQ